MGATLGARAYDGSSGVDGKLLLQENVRVAVLGLALVGPKQMTDGAAGMGRESGCGGFHEPS